MPHITDYRITLLVGVAIMAFTFFVFRLVGGWLSRRAQPDAQSAQE